jgi:hypothetical protein
MQPFRTSMMIVQTPIEIRIYATTDPTQLPAYDQPRASLSDDGRALIVVEAVE